MVRIIAYQVAQQINIKKVKEAYKAELLSSSSVDLFYFDKEKNKAIYVLSYGVVVFANHDAIETSRFIEFIKPFSISFLEIPYKEDLNIQQSNELSFSYNDVQLPDPNSQVIGIVMINVAQSVFLDFYTDISQDLLEKSAIFTNELENFGRMKISRKNLLKFIGKTLNTKNRIVDNLYIFDVPDIVWEDEYMGKVNNGMVKTFDINTRFREIEYTLKIVESNLSIFTQLVQEKRSNALELIIIFLILFEIINTLIVYVIN